MVVVLAAVCAYRYHCQLQQDEEEEDEQLHPQEGTPTATSSSTSTSLTPASLNQTLAAHWQSTETVRRTSSDLVRTALSCQVAAPEDEQLADDEDKLEYKWTAARSTSGTTSRSRRRRRRRRRTTNPHSSLTSTSPRNMAHASQVFREDVRQRWIDAVFGSDFYATPDYVAPKQGTGEAGIESFVAYTATIPVGGDSKLGLTLSKLALGLYVRHVAPHSEAQSAGVHKGSILVSINDQMRMLGEPSRQALERMWQYEGLLESGAGASKKPEPVSLTFYHPDGHLYSVVLFTTPFGISWAPCGHFALVQRSYAAAANAGVRRGSLIASIMGYNEYSLRQLKDHVDWGMRLQEQKSGEMGVAFCYAPTASRPGQYEREMSEEKNGVTKKGHLAGTRTEDGIEVRVHPLEYSIRSLWNSPTRGGRSPKKEEIVQEGANSITNLAREVVVGQVLAPTKRRDSSHITRLATDRRYGAPPLFPGILKKWGALDALVYCLRFQQASYHEVLMPTNETSVGLLERIGTKSCETFLLSCVGMLCQADDRGETDIIYGEQLVGVLLTIARGNEDFCRRLHFLLRSFCATLGNNRVLAVAKGSLAKQMSRDPTRVSVSPRAAPSKSLFLEEERLEPSAPHEDRSPTSVNDGPVVAVRRETLKKKKSVFRVLKRKSKKHEVKAEPSVASESSQSSETASARMMVLPVPLAQPELLSLPALLDNATQLVRELDKICDTIERSLLRSISQKVANWALQPWSPSKETALAKVTEAMRINLSANVPETMPMMNPVDSAEVLLSVDPKECYILPSAHFPLLLTLNVDGKATDGRKTLLPRRQEKLYRTRVEILSMHGNVAFAENVRQGIGRSYFVHASVAGVVKESRRSSDNGGSSIDHSWAKGSLLTFDTRSSWGAPQTLSLRVSSVDVASSGKDVVAKADDTGRLHYSSEVGYSWVDLKPIWVEADNTSRTASSVLQAKVLSGDVTSTHQIPERLELKVKVTTELLDFGEASDESQTRKRMLLYKHDDDLRQEMFAVEFLRTCDALLKASGLDLKLLTFECVPVGLERGFVEWIPGSIPLSEICRSPFVGTRDDRETSTEKIGDVGIDQSLSEVARAGFTKYQSLHRLGPPRSGNGRDAPDNSIQEFLRSVAFDPDEPYSIRKEVMDTYLKSCAGYCVLSYILGVGDRHLDNLLLHQTGHFFHCDFSFILGRDPKKYSPMRITEAMVRGMGGRESDGYALFLSLAGAAFCVLRRHENVRVLLSLVRTMAAADLPDVSVHQSVDECVQSMMQRLRLEQSDDEAITYMENLIESSISSKLWIAVDAIHSFGKRF